MLKSGFYGPILEAVVYCIVENSLSGSSMVERVESFWNVDIYVKCIGNEHWCMGLGFCGCMVAKISATIFWLYNKGRGAYSKLYGIHMYLIKKNYYWPKHNPCLYSQHTHIMHVSKLWKINYYYHMEMHNYTIASHFLIYVIKKPSK